MVSIVFKVIVNVEELLDIFEIVNVLNLSIIVKMIESR